MQKSMIFLNIKSYLCLQTNFIPKPLAATSVATRIGALPLRKSAKKYVYYKIGKLHISQNQYKKNNIMLGNDCFINIAVVFG